VSDRALLSVRGWIAGAFVMTPLAACCFARLGYDLVPSGPLDDLGDLVGPRLHRAVWLVIYELLRIPPSLAFAGLCVAAVAVWWCARRTEVWVDEHRRLLVARTTRLPLPTKVVFVPLSEVHGVRTERWLPFWVVLDEFDLPRRLCLRFGGRRELAALAAHVRRLRGD